MGRDPISEIERAAQDDRAEHERRTGPPRRVRVPGALLKQDERGVARARIRMALTDDNTRWRFAGALVLCAWPMLLALVAISKDLPIKPVPAFLTPLRDLGSQCGWPLFLGSMALTAVLFALYTRALSAIRLIWLYRVGHGFDVKRYLDLLSLNRREGTLVVRFGFARSWDEKLRESTRAAVHHWMRGLAQITWVSDSALEVKSDRLETIAERVRIYLHGGGDESVVSRHYSNRPIHDCFVELVRHVLPKLDAAVRVQHLDVNIEGETLPWYARAANS